MGDLAPELTVDSADGDEVSSRTVSCSNGTGVEDSSIVTSESSCLLVSAKAVGRLVLMISIIYLLPTSTLFVASYA